MGEVAVSNEGGTEMAATETEKKNNQEGDEGPASAANPSTSVVRWERFLPKMVMRVLLVEADDSTRQIITALLRKCSYRVAAVPDGLKAWELLKGRPHNIDLILTEVDLPSISGFALLTLITEHEICKNIPVIMMSSQDSVSTVYKCMMRGAADFLMKPIRKNELRNLWQHVWRRQASSASGLGPPDESVAQQKFEATAENNAISNPSSGYVACIQRNQECIEKGSDAQSSCMKPEIETEEADIECMQDISQPKGSRSSSSDMNMQQQEDDLKANDNLQMHDTDIAGLQAAVGLTSETMTPREDMNIEDHLQQGEFTVETLDSSHILANPSREAIDLIGAFDNYLKCTYGNSASTMVVNKTDSPLLLDLSLRRSHPSGSVNQGTNESNRLNHSDASAFSRYVNKASQPQQSTSPSTCDQQKGLINNSATQLSNYALDYNSDARAPTASSQRHIPLAVGQRGQAEISFTSPQRSALPAPIPVRGLRFENLSNAFGPMVPPVFCLQSGLSQVQSSGSAGHQEASFQANTFHPLDQQPRTSRQCNNSMDQTTNDATDQTENRGEHKLETLEDRCHITSTDQSANSSFCNGTVSHNPSISFGSNGIFNTLSIIKATSECGKEESFPTHDGNSHRSMQREAALTKFRLKRKERCYEKKVRYESRKKLAEQRPRVKGQFVRQVQSEPPTGCSS